MGAVEMRPTETDLLQHVRSTHSVHIILAEMTTQHEGSADVIHYRREDVPQQWVHPRFQDDCNATAGCLDDLMDIMDPI
jgi:hypothetical protein